MSPARTAGRLPAPAERCNIATLSTRRVTVPTVFRPRPAPPLLLSRLPCPGPTSSASALSRLHHFRSCPAPTLGTPLVTTLPSPNPVRACSASALIGQPLPCPVPSPCSPRASGLIFQLLPYHIPRPCPFRARSASTSSIQSPPYHALSCPVVPCHAMPCPVLSVLSFHACPASASFPGTTLPCAARM